MGASNLAFAHKPVLQRLANSCPAGSSIFLAHGPGRSYGLNAGNPLWRYQGHVHSDLWADLEAAVAAQEQPRISALITDVGNDLLYTRGHSLPGRWVKRICERLAGMGAHCAVTSLPMASILALSPLKFGMLRPLFFPRFRVEREAMFGWAESLQDQLSNLCQQHNFQLLPAEPQWYGPDHFHLKWFKRKEVFNLWLNSLLQEPTLAEPMLQECTQTGQLRVMPRLQRNQDWFLGRQRQRPQTGAMLAEAVRIYFY